MDKIKINAYHFFFDIQSFLNQWWCRLTGTCFSPPECQSKTGGLADGPCANGFGTCCVILLSECGGSIGENSTHFSSPDYPTVYQTAATCTYTLNKVETDICFLRLEFINFVIDGPVSSASFPNQNWDCTNDKVRHQLFVVLRLHWKPFFNL